jgi:putative MATE family efflux protein
MPCCVATLCAPRKPVSTSEVMNVIEEPAELDEVVDGVVNREATHEELAVEAEAVIATPGSLGQAPGILQLAWPAVLGNLLMSIVGIVGIKVVGVLGTEAVAAVTTGHRIFFISQGVLMALTAGTTAMVARAWGAGDKEEAGRITRASVVIGVGLAVVLATPCILFADELVGIFKLDPKTLENAATFIRWISVFNIGFALTMVIGSAVRAAGDTITPLWIGAVTNIVNVFLLYGLVYGRYGFPELGVRGAALASGIAFAVGAVISVVMWMKGWLIIGVGTGPALTKKRFRQLIRIGLPAGVEQFILQVGFVAFLYVVAFYGTAPYAAYGIGVQLLSLSFVIGFGFAIAASTLVGQKLGALDPEGAARSGWRAMWLSVGAMTVIGAIIIATAETTAAMMIDDPEVIRLTVVFIYILGAVQPLMAMEFALGGALRGAGDTRFPMITTLTGLVLVRGSVAALGAYLGLSVEWIYAALIVDYIVKASLLAWRFRQDKWKLIEL